MLLYRCRQPAGLLVIVAAVQLLMRVQRMKCSARFLLLLQSIQPVFGPFLQIRPSVSIHKDLSPYRHVLGPKLGYCCQCLPELVLTV